MRIAISFAICFFSVQLFSQDCNSSALFKKGAELTYKTHFLFIEKSSKGDFDECTRLQFTVTDVKDSNSIRYSYITKIGTNPLDPKQFYTKKYVLKCDGTKITIPFDFYLIDTIYLTNVHPKEKNITGYYLATNAYPSGPSKFPLDFEKSGFEWPYSATYNIRFRDLMYQSTAKQQGTYVRGNTTELKEFPFEFEVEYTKKDVKAKEKVISEAGSFDCNGISITAESKGMFKKRSGTYSVYYSAEVGLVKSAETQGKKEAQSFELISVKFN